MHCIIIFGLRSVYSILLALYSVLKKCFSKLLFFSLCATLKLIPFFYNHVKTHGCLSPKGSNLFYNKLVRASLVVNVVFFH